MRLRYSLGIACCVIGVACAATAAPPSASPKNPKEHAPQQLEVTAAQSLEYYQDKRLYVARGDAKAVRGTMTVTADTLTAHEREKPKGIKQPKQAAGNKSGAGDIDMMTAEGNVVITDPRQRITGEHAVYDLDKHKMIVTGNNLRYETAKEVVTATDSLEYYEDTKLAIARGHAIADQPARHIAGDVLTAEFRDAPNGESQLTKMTAQGHVTVITKSGDATQDKAKAAPPTGLAPKNSTKSENTKASRTKGGDVSRGDRAVYDAGSNVAILTGDVRITRSDGTELSGDVGEVNFNTNQNRLMNDGTSRVRALLPPKTTEKATAKAPPQPPEAEEPATMEP